jgi:hypothetical protein
VYTSSSRLVATRGRDVYQLAADITGMRVAD